MNRNLLILFCLGLVGNAFAMRHTLEDEESIEKNALYPKYLDVKVAYEKMTSPGEDNFFNLSLKELENLLKNPLFATDNENSVLFLVIEYLKHYKEYHDFPINEDELPNLLKNIHWHDVTLQYLQTILELNHPSLSLLKRICEEEYSRRVNNEPANSGGSRIKFNAPESISIEFVGENVNTWDSEQKHDSSTIFAHGYLINYFFKREPRDDKFGLGGYLHVQGPGDNLYDVPLRYSVVISGRDGKKRHFNPVNVILKTNLRSIGKMLTTNQETWRDVEIGKSIIVNNNAIKATLSIDFLGSLLYVDVSEAYNALSRGKLFNHTIEKFIQLIESPAFGTDNEDSVLFLVFKYLKYCQDHNRKITIRQLDHLLNAIRWHDVTPNYLTSFVDHPGRLLISLGNRCSAQKTNNKVHPRLKARFKIGGPKTLLKCVFRDVNKWEGGRKYYSTPMLINGYEFYYFLQRLRIGNSEPPNYGLAGFLKLNRPVERTYNIPVEYRVMIIQRDGQERRFNNIKINFQETEKAIGGNLTTIDETWDKVISGQANLVDNNTITVIVSIEMPDADDGHFVTLQ